MSQVKVSGNASGTGIFEIAAPNTNTNYTLTLPQATTTLVGTDATQTLTNKTIQGGAVTSGTAVASTSGTSIDFTSIPSWVKRITVMFSGVSGSGTSLKQVQLGTSGGVQTTGYITFASYTGASSGGTTATSGFLVETGSGGASNIIYGNAVITLLDSATGTWTYCATLGLSSGGNYTIQGGGTKTLSGTLDRVRITTVNGTDTFDAGSINILYE